MSFNATSTGEQAVIRDPAQFDHRSGSALERLLFNHRLAVALACLLATVLLGWQATRLTLNASFEDMIPASHPYIANYLEHKDGLSGLGNAVRIAVAANGGSVYDAGYLASLQKISDEIFLLPGVDRAYMKSLWTPSTRWVGVTEDGMEGGPVIPNDYDGSPGSVAQVRDNVARSGEIGQLVAVDGRSSIIYVPLLERGPDGEALDYAALGGRLEQLRAKYGNGNGGGNVTLHIVGFAKVAGDLIEGLRQVLVFFAASTAIAAAMLYWYTRCARSTVLVVACSLVAVVWQLGLLPLLGYGLDPYSMLVPFLVFAIGMSHGAQKMNGIMQDIGRGTHKLVAARYTFRRLFLAGLAALLCDAVGFAVLALIDIKVIKDLAAVASIGVAALILTNLILLPILLSWLGVDGAAARRSLRAEVDDAADVGRWRVLEAFTARRTAAVTIAVATVLGVAGYLVSLQLKVGDLDPGAPELRPDSRYNRDNAYVVDHYAASSDVFAVMVKTPDGACAGYDTLMKVDALEWQLAQLPAVETTNSLALLNRRVLAGLNEGSAKWYELVQNQGALNMVTAGAPRGLYNDTCNLLTLYAWLTDHKADTLASVVRTVEQFARDNDTADVKFLLAAGNAGIEAATNIVVHEASRAMLWWVYAAVTALCLVTFRSWRAVLCAVIPLVLTSILCEALMVWLGIGVKVATLPVIALGVGIGIDYALYVMSILLARQKAGDTLAQAYRHALRFTGKVVLLTGVTLAIAVATWALSPIKFQADMGILLAFMFLWNMVGALVLLPALAAFLMPGGRRRAVAAGIPRPALAE